MLLQINLLPYSLQFFRSALTEGLLETAINEFQSFVKEIGGFVVTNQSVDISLHCEAGQVLRDNKRCGKSSLFY